MHMVWPGRPTRYIVAPITLPLLKRSKRSKHDWVSAQLLSAISVIQSTQVRNCTRRAWCGRAAGRDSTNSRSPPRKSRSTRSVQISESVRRHCAERGHLFASFSRLSRTQSASGDATATTQRSLSAESGSVAVKCGIRRRAEGPKEFDFASCLYYSARFVNV